LARDDLDELDATALRNSSPGVTASPGQPFSTGPSTTKCWSRVLHSTRPNVSVERAWAT
jgi:hypothetical protein